MENICSSKECNQNDIEQQNKIFDKIFKDYFPSLGDNECKYESKKIKNKENA